MRQSDGSFPFAGWGDEILGNVTPIVPAYPDKKE
jgi:hypothetical protein